MNALIDSYGADSYHEAVMMKIKRAKEHPDYYKDEIETGRWGPFWVYDLFDEKDRADAIKAWGDLLSGWMASYCVTARHGDEEGVTIDPGTIENYNEVVRRVCNVLDVSEYDLEDWLSGAEHSEIPTRWIRSDKPDPKTKCYGHREPLDETTVKFFQNFRRECGIMTNLEALKCECARFFVHADDNVLPCGKVDELGQNDEYGSEEKKDWVTEMCSFDRVCEVVYTYLVKIGRIKPDDPKFMKEMEVDPKFLSKTEIANGEIYDFRNGKSLTWNDLRHIALTCIMHEG